MKTTQRRPIGQAGFTIVELLIATLVFSVILIVITVGVVSFTNAYYKGLNASTTQTTTRASLQAVSQAIQFSSGSISIPAGSPSPPTTYCIGDVQFDLVRGTALNGSNHALYETSRSGDSGQPCTPAAFAAGSKELLGKHMRLAVFTITPPTGVGVFSIHINVAYGDADLLCNTGKSGVTKGSCAAGAASYAPTDLVTGNDVACKLQRGSQFCTVTDLTTAVEKRIQ